MSQLGIRLIAFIKASTPNLTMAQRLKVIRIVAYFLVFDGSFLMVISSYLLHFAWSNNPLWLIRLAEAGSVVALAFGLCSYLISTQFFVRAPLWFSKETSDSTYPFV